MTINKLVFAVIFILLSFNYLKNVRAQDTFGPVCDDITVTCIPTQSPTETPPVSPTETPAESPTPTETPSPTPTGLPRAGTMDNVRNGILFAVFLIFAGSLGRHALSPKK